MVTPPSRLVRATVSRFARELAPLALDTAVNWRTSVPRAVGLGGSSAIVIATLRALCELYEISLSSTELAAFALAVEAKDLGIAAGLQDRVAQAYEGLTFMDFAAERYEQLDELLLPPLLVAWRADAGQDSGGVHSPLRERFERGEPAVLAAMSKTARSAWRARDALLAGDLEELGRCVDASFDARRAMMALHPSHVEMVELARACGASANYTGSGGAIVAVCRDQQHRRAVGERLAGAGCGTTQMGVRAAV
jgi:glucuronokinase